MQLMMIAWPVLALVVLQTLYAFGLSSTLTWWVPQIDYALCKSFSFNQIYVLPSTSLNVSLSLNSKKHQINYALCIFLSPPHPLPSQASSSIYSNSSIVSALKEVGASFPMGFWDVWSLGAVPKLPLLTCKLLLLHEKFSELQQSAAPFDPAPPSFTMGGTTEPWGINMIMLYSFTLKILSTGIVAQQHETVYHCWLH